MSTIGTHNINSQPSEKRAGNHKTAQRVVAISRDTPQFHNGGKREDDAKKKDKEIPILNQLVKKMPQESKDASSIQCCTGMPSPRRVITGSNGDDWLKGTQANDVIRGRGGDDWLSGEKGNDRLYGGKGDDYLQGGRGKDILKGGRGDDDLQGGRGSDTLRGGKGDDWLEGGRGVDRLFGGQGDDHLFGGRRVSDIGPVGRSQCRVRKNI
jgi:Ca2+-binding RTX toxin-like protein